MAMPERALDEAENPRRRPRRPAMQAVELLKRMFGADDSFDLLLEAALATPDHIGAVRAVDRMGRVAAPAGPVM